MIKLRFTRNHSFTSYFIRLFTWSEYSHVEFELEDGYLGAYTDVGVQLRPFNYDPANTFQKAQVGVPDLATEQKIIEFAKLQIGKPFDYTGVIGIGFHRDWHAPDHWFCSELVAAAFDSAAYPLIKSRVDRVTPQMIYECEQVVLV